MEGMSLPWITMIYHEMSWIHVTLNPETCVNYRELSWKTIRINITNFPEWWWNLANWQFQLTRGALPLPRSWQADKFTTLPDISNIFHLPVPYVTLSYDDWIPLQCDKLQVLYQVKQTVWKRCGKCLHSKIFLNIQKLTESQWAFFFFPINRQE